MRKDRLNKFGVLTYTIYGYGRNYNLAEYMVRPCNPPQTALHKLQGTHNLPSRLGKTSKPDAYELPKIPLHQQLK